MSTAVLLPSTPVGEPVDPSSADLLSIGIAIAAIVAVALVALASGGAGTRYRRLPPPQTRADPPPCALVRPAGAASRRDR